MPFRYRFSLSIFAVLCLLCTASSSLAQRPKTRPNQKPKPPASAPVVKEPERTDPFSEVVRKLLASAPDGFLALRKSKKQTPISGAEQWDTEIHFPESYSNCYILVLSAFSEASCYLGDDSQVSLSFGSPALAQGLTSASQDAQDLFERYCDRFLRVLPADWAVNLDDFLPESRPQNSILPVIEDRKLTFFSPDPEKTSVEISRRSFGNVSINRSIWVEIRSGIPYKAGGGQRVGELRDSVPLNQSVIVTIREKARTYSLQSLKAQMLWALNRYRETAGICNSLTPEPWFCKSARESAARPLTESNADELYQAEKYEQALVASTLAIQKTRTRKSLQADNAAFSSQFQQRALIEAALGQVSAALQDFNKAAAIKSVLPQTGLGFNTLEFQEAIVLYMYGTPSAGEQACAQAAKVATGISSLVTDLCDKMKKATLAVGQLKPDTQAGQFSISARHPNSLTLLNPSEFDAVVKLLGPSSQAFALPKGKNVSLAVEPGEYRSLLRYTKLDKQYIYAKGGPFTIAQTSTAHSETSITLPKHPKAGSNAQKQFEQAQIAISEHPLTEIPNSSDTNGGFHFVRAITSSLEEITSLSFSQDSSELAASNSGSVTIWDVETGDEVWRSPQNAGKNVDFSPDSKLLALERANGSHFVIDLVEPKENKSIRQFDHAEGDSSISFSPDGRLLAFGGRDTIQVSHVSTGDAVFRITSKKDAIGSVAFSADGHSLASTGKNGVVLWDAGDGKRLRDFGPGEFVAFSPDGETLASAASPTITLWNLVSGKSIRTLAGRAPMVFSRDSRWLASRSADGRLATIWNVATGEQLATLGDPSDEVTSVALSPDGKWLAAGSEYDTVWLWRRPSRTQGAQADTQHEKAASPTPLRPESSPAVSPGSAEAKLAVAPVKDSQDSTIVFFRESHLSGTALRPSVYLDGNELDRLADGRWFSVHVAPGKHELHSSAKNEPATVIETVAGQTAYVRMVLVTGKWRGTGRLIEVSTADAQKVIGKLKPLYD